MLQDWLVDVPNAITRIWAEQGIYSFAPSPFRRGWSGTWRETAWRRAARANLEGAKLTGADLREANLIDATGWDTVKGKKTIIGLDTAVNVPTDQ